MWISRKKYTGLIEELTEQERNIKDKEARIGRLEYLLGLKEAECKELKQRVFRSCGMYKVTISLSDLTTHTYTVVASSVDDAGEMVRNLFLKENKDYIKKDIACIFVNNIQGGI